MRKLHRFFSFNFLFVLVLLALAVLFSGCLGIGGEKKAAGACSGVCPAEAIQAPFPDCRCMAPEVNKTTNQTEYVYIRQKCSWNCSENEEQMPFPDCACLLKTIASQNATTPNESNAETEAPKTNAWSKLYELNKVNAYEYSKKMVDGNNTATVESFEASVSVVLLNGKSVFLVNTSGGGRAWSEWREQNYLSCMKRVEFKKYSLEKITEEQPCPVSNKYWNYYTPGYNASVQLKEVGRKENANASVGMVNVVVYEVSGVEGVQVWKAANIPVPVKITNNVTKTEVELIAYS